MSDDWRDIPMRVIGWRALYNRIGRSAYKLEWLCRAWRDRAPVPYGRGCWHNLTLGQVADLGAQEILRHAGIGQITLERLQDVISMAAAGALSTGDGPAPDALRPPGGNPMIDRIDTTVERAKLAALKGSVYYRCDGCSDESNYHEADSMCMLPDGGIACDVCCDDGGPPLPPVLDLQTAYAVALDEIDRLREALSMCPPLSNPLIPVEKHLENMNRWWRIWVSPAIAGKTKESSG